MIIILLFMGIAKESKTETYNYMDL